MIAIQRSNLDILAQCHYDQVMNKKPGSRQWTVQKYLEKLHNKCGRTTYKRKFVDKLLTDLVISNNDLDKSILTCNPRILEKKFKEYNSTFPRLSRDTKFLKKLENCFFYHDYDKWGAYKLAESLDVNVCPYCNRQYTFTIGNDLSKGTRPQFDHFINKAAAPYFALSFYNLIPSCNICNSNFKKDKEITLDKYIHPYIDNYMDDMVFSIDVTDVKFIDGKPEAYSLEFEKSIHSTLSDVELSRIKTSFELFGLDILYQKHKDYVNELIQKSRIYTPAHVKSIYKQYKGTLFRDENEAFQMLMGNYLLANDLEKRPLAKLTRDINIHLRMLSR